MDWKGRIDLFVFDLDGTALGGYEPYERLPDPFSAFLDELDGQGVRWCVNTTWHPLKQAAMISRSGVRSCAAYLYGRTGILRAVPEGKAAYRMDAAWETRAKALESRVGELFRDWEKVLRAAGLLKNGSFEEVPGEPLMRRCAVDPARSGEAGLVLERLRREVPGVYAGARSPDGCVVLQPLAMSKGEAVRTLQRDLRVPAARILAAGDEQNDLPMLQADCAGFVVCPSNACDSVKALVCRRKGVVGMRPFADGVIEAARRL